MSENVTSPDSGSVATPTTPATPSAPTTQVAPAQQQATPAATPTSATPSTPPEGWVPSYRLREQRDSILREANQQFEAREATIRAEADRYRQQVMALTGVTAPPNPEIAAVRGQFGELFPGLAKLEDKAAQLEALIERAGDLQSSTDHYWTSYGRQTMDRLFEHAQTSLGGPLTEDAKRQLHASFIGFVQSSPEMTARYANDPSIVNDFWKEFTSNFIDPVRRNSAAGVVARASTVLPQDSPAGIPRPAAPAAPRSLDERADAAWALFNQHKNG